MSCLWQSAARVVTIVAIVLSLSNGAHAVAAFGTAKRVDVDPAGTPIHQFGVFNVTRSPTGGFVAAWEENTKTENPLVYEGIRFRVFGNTFAPVAGQKSADISGNKRVPTISGVVPLGPDKAYLIYALTRDNANLDHPEIREAFGQKIALGTGAASGARQLLNAPATGNWDSLIGIPSGLSGGRAVFAWYEADEVAPAPGRFISSAGALQPATLNFACCGSIKEAQLVRLQPLGTGFLADYVRRSVFGNSGFYARVFTSNGQPLAAAKYFAVDPIRSSIPKALSNGNIAVFSTVLVSSNPDKYKLVAQVYNKNWATIVTAKTLVPDLTSTKYVDFAPTLDGGVFMLRTLLNGSVYTRSVRRLNAAFTPVAPDYIFAASSFDFFRVAALSNNRAVVLFRNIVGGRHQLFAQIVSY